MEPETVKADKAYRARLLAGYAAVLLALLTLGPWLTLIFLRYLDRAAVPQKLLAAETAGIGFLLLFILPSAYLIATGRRAIRESRWPHSGMKVIHDTAVLRGRRAVSRGRFHVWLGAACIFLVLAGSSATRFIFHKFKTDPFFFVRKQMPAKEIQPPRGTAPGIDM